MFVFSFREFSMSTSFPRREFTARDDDQTVCEAQLVPTAVILILPVSASCCSECHSLETSVILKKP